MPQRPSWPNAACRHRAASPPFLITHVIEYPVAVPTASLFVTAAAAGATMCHGGAGHRLPLRVAVRAAGVACGCWRTPVGGSRPLVPLAVCGDAKVGLYRSLLAGVAGSGRDGGRWRSASALVARRGARRDRDWATGWGRVARALAAAPRARTAICCCRGHRGFATASTAVAAAASAPAASSAVAAAATDVAITPATCTADAVVASPASAAAATAAAFVLAPDAVASTVTQRRTRTPPTADDTGWTAVDSTGGGWMVAGSHAACGCTGPTAMVPAGTDDRLSRRRLRRPSRLPLPLPRPQFLLTP